MEVSFTLWTMHDILSKIPFEEAAGEAIHLDFSAMAVPYYVKDGFKVSIFYEDDTYPLDATCSIFSPQNVVTIVIIIKRKYEDALNRWLKNGNKADLALCYRRRELYCHETSHLIAIIRAYPSNRSSRVRKDFEERIKAKFEGAIHEDERTMVSSFISQENPEDSPSVFDKDHFRYEDDSLNYFKLYTELMLGYNAAYKALKKISDSKKQSGPIYFEEIARETLVTPDLFKLYPEKVAELRKILEDGFD